MPKVLQGPKGGLQRPKGAKRAKKGLQRPKGAKGDKRSYQGQKAATKALKTLFGDFLVSDGNKTMRSRTYSLSPITIFSRYVQYFAMLNKIRR